MLSSFASLLFLVAGYILISNEQSLKMFPWKAVVFLFVVYTLLLPLKDLKDEEGDDQNGVFTLATIFGQENARMILGALLFLSYFGSAVILNEKALFIPALLFGLLGYWLTTNKKIKINSLTWWTLGIVVVYGILLVLIIFA